MHNNHKIIGPELGRGEDCEAILRSLPKWLGIEASVQMYVRDSSRYPGFGYEVGGVLRGFISLKKHFPCAWEVHCMAVLLTERNTGVGSRLLAHAEDWLASQSARFLQVKTIADTSADPYYAETREFYLRKGYEPVEVFPKLWGPSNPALQLVKCLKVSSNGFERVN